MEKRQIHPVEEIDARLAEFDIVFTDPEKQKCPVFHSGDVIDGKVIIHVIEPMETRSIHVNIYGKVNVSLKKGEVSAEETCLNKHIQLFGNLRENKQTLEPGNYEYAFTFTLKNALPSPIESEHGWIRYGVEAIIDNPVVPPMKQSDQPRLRVSDHKVELPFTVIASDVDLNNIPDCAFAVEVFGDTTMGALCCVSDPITVHMQLHRTAFVPGEYIFVIATINNKSNRRMKSSSMRLIQKLAFHAGEEVCYEDRIIQEVKREGIDCKEIQEYHNSPLKIPPCAPSGVDGLQGCELIDVEYEVEIKIEPEGHKKLSDPIEIQIPITIGTIPLTDSWDHYLQICQPDAAKKSKKEKQDKSDGNESFVPSRSYDEAVWGYVRGTDEGLRADESGWKPMYTNFDYPKPSFH